jgi:hypothetical protein
MTAIAALKLHKTETINSALVEWGKRLDKSTYYWKSIYDRPKTTLKTVIVIAISVRKEQRK